MLIIMPGDEIHHTHLPVHRRVHGGLGGSRRMLEAWTPNEIALALAAADEVADRHQRVGRVAEFAVDRARYEADRAERAFHAVEPENRLVASTLEIRWETKLAALAAADQALEAARHTLPPLPGRSELEKLAADLPGLWHAPTTSDKDRKRLLRTLIADVTLLPEPEHGQARIPIRWRTGASDELRGSSFRSPRNCRAQTLPGSRHGDPTRPDHRHPRTGAPAQRRRDDHRPRTPFDVKAVQWVRHAYHVPAPNPYADGEISVADAADVSAPASTSSTTGSRPANSPGAAAPATGSASPGLTASRPNAVAA